MLVHRLRQQVVWGAREAAALPEELGPNSSYPKAESSGNRTCILPKKEQSFVDQSEASPVRSNTTRFSLSVLQVRAKSSYRKAKVKLKTRF